MEAAANSVLRHSKFVPRLRTPGVEFRQRLLKEVKACASCVHLKVGSRAIAFDRVAPLRNLPLEFNLWKRSRLRQVHLHAAARGLDVADIDKTRQSRCPKARDRPSARIHRQVI